MGSVVRLSYKMSEKCVSFLHPLVPLLYLYLLAYNVLLYFLLHPSWS